MRGGDLLRQRIEIGGVVVVGNGEFPGRMERVEWRAFLDGQLVERQMVGGVADRPLEFGLPRFRGLAGRA